MAVVKTPTITSVVLKGLQTLTLPLTSVARHTDKYILKGMDGLDAPAQSIAIARTGRGGKYQGSESESRELVALIALNGSDPKTLRNNLYTMIDTGYNPRVKIMLYAGSVYVSYVWAYVTNFEAALYVKDPVVQITFECANPTFRAPKVTQYLSSELNEKNPNIYNPGTAATGFQFGVRFNDDMDRWYIRQSEHSQFAMTFEKEFHAGDVLEVSTISGKRYVHWKKHKGKVQNKLGLLRKDSEWIGLYPGNNHFSVSKETDKWQWKGKLSFTAEYWGV